MNTIALINQNNLSQVTDLSGYSSYIQVNRVESYLNDKDSMDRFIPVWGYYIELRCSGETFTSGQTENLTSLNAIFFETEEEYAAYMYEHYDNMIVEDTTLEINLTQDNLTAMGRRLLFEKILIDNINKKVKVDYFRQTLSPNNSVIISEPRFYEISGERFHHWVNLTPNRTLGETILKGVEDKLKDDYRSDLPQ
jgi:hypothetical protein